MLSSTRVTKPSVNLHVPVIFFNYCFKPVMLINIGFTDPVVPFFQSFPLLTLGRGPSKESTNRRVFYFSTFIV